MDPNIRQWNFVWMRTWILVLEQRTEQKNRIVKKTEQLYKSVVVVWLIDSSCLYTTRKGIRN